MEHEEFDTTDVVELIDDDKLYLFIERNYYV